ANYELAYWAYDKGYLEIAKKEVEEALEKRPDYELAQLLLKRIERRLKSPSGEGTETIGEPGGIVAPQDLMDMVDVNRIRLAELRETDDVGIAFVDNVLRKFLEAYRGRGIFAMPGGEREFMEYSNMEKALYVLRSVDRENYDVKDKVIVRGEPSFMVQFTQNVWPVVARNCAGPQCHGGGKIVGKLKLFRGPGQRIRLNYTNFYTLQNYRKDALDMIDRSNPEKSLLLNFGLPESVAEFHHPERITPVFTDRSDRAYQKILDWIRALKSPYHRYGVNYKPVTGEGPPIRPERRRPEIPPEGEEFVPPPPGSIPERGRERELR
ncbi:MAG: hypothetical protein ACYTF6_12480, partial [Planctomycetota bacterium]